MLIWLFAVSLQVFADSRQPVLVKVTESGDVNAANSFKTYFHSFSLTFNLPCVLEHTLITQSFLICFPSNYKKA